MNFWLEEDIKQRTNSHETYYSYCGIDKNHIVPVLGKKKMADVNRGDIQKLFNTKASYSRSVAEQVKTIMNVSFDYAVTKKVISNSPVKGVNLPKAEHSQRRAGFRTRNIDISKTLTLEWIHMVIIDRNIIADGVPEIEAYMTEVLPDPEAEKRFKEELLEIVLDVSQFLLDIA